MIVQQRVMVSNIQHFCLHDGPGIRTTVFVKGCSLKCPWCSNPENISPEVQVYRTEKDEVGTCGIEMSCEEIWNEIAKDKVFYGEGGGVTFSGGEALLQASRLIPLMKKCKQENINQCVETALFVSEEQLNIFVEYMNYFIVDMKIMNAERCREIMGGTLDVYKKNILTIQQSGIPFTIRIPLIEHYTTEAENIALICEFVKEYGLTPDRVELLKGHNLARQKYRALDKQMYEVPELSEQKMEYIRGKIDELNIPYAILKV